MFFKRNQVEKSPVDLDKPVENPELLKAINQFLNHRSLETQVLLGKELNKANYLIAIITDEMQTEPSDNTGMVKVKKGSLIKIMNCCDKDGKAFLPIFTDWNEIKLWTSETVSTIVMPANQAWDFVMKQNQYEGAMMNPASIGWTLSKKEIGALIEDENFKS